MTNQQPLDDPDYREKIIDLCKRCIDMDPREYRKELRKIRKLRR